MKTLWRRVKIAAQIVSFLWNLVVFARKLSKANKEEDIEEKKQSILGSLGDLVKKIPYELPGLLISEFKNKGE